MSLRANPPVRLRRPGVRLSWNHFSVPFTGTSIGVYETFDPNSAGVETSYEIDGGPTTTVTSPSSGQDSYQQLFWQSDPVGTGPQRDISARFLLNQVAKAGEGTVWFDYFNVTHAGPASSSPPKHAALIGGIAAGVVILIIAAGLLLLYLRRQRKHKSSLSAQSSYKPSESANSQSQSHGPQFTADNTEHSSYIADLKRRQQQVVSSYEAGINGGNAHSAPIQHVNSGVRELTPATAESGPAELPPVYTAT
ncbi:hypothetical protein DFH08DRAFT_798853 [Mycena albidolilacea]|uniref:Uncharacterized protein n=1 Tax=Mycena albidolilacea TaxID=1033008 RepID=A0AAD7APF7_9AGAR|nr:hypothetical protein DFH08DRAFT_798853 [Mycena albidolilacea]